MDKLRLFCLPHAGASASIFIKWKGLFPPNIEIVPLELAGRGQRWNEPLYHTLDEAVDDIFHRISNQLHEMPYVFLGHSMGGLIAYELIHRISKSGLPTPQFSVFSGVNPPHRKLNKGRYLLPDDELIKELQSMGGVSKELLSDVELLSLFLPIIRADFKIVETYISKEDQSKFNFDILVLRGENDVLTPRERMEEWMRYSSKDCSIHDLEGTHFFLYEHVEKVSKIVEAKLCEV